jgi:electron transfer flavoprotein alpha subunit
MSHRVLVLCPTSTSTIGLLSVAGELAGAGGSVGALCMDSGSAPPNFESVAVIYQVSSEGFDAGRGDHLAAAVVEAARAFDASVIVSGPTKLEREALARAGAVLGGPTTTGVRSVRIEGDGLVVSRDLLSGNARAIELVSGRPVLLSLSGESSGVGGTVEPGPKGEIVPLLVPLPTYPFRRVSRQPKPAGGLRLESADRVVSVGRGLQRKEDLALIEALAAALGAAVGCTRPIAAESGWLSDEHWVGLTGHRVRPTLYIAIGISGAAQHLVGMRDSRIVVAVNTDASAPIFQQADYQVVGDLYAIVPELTRRWTVSATGSS